MTVVRDGSGVLTIFYHDPAGRAYAMERGAERYYIVSDQRRSPRAVVDNTGTVVKVLEYDSYGNVLSDSNPGFPLPVGFAGGLRDDATGLVRFGLRDYDPGSGRWVTRCPVLYAGRQRNLFAYVNNDPVDFIDPFGMFSFGASAYDGVGGGFKVSFTNKGFSWCGEVGIGFGVSVEVDPFGGLDRNRGSIAAKATGKAGVVGGRSTPIWALRMTATRLPQRCASGRSARGETAAP